MLVNKEQMDKHFVHQAEGLIDCSIDDVKNNIKRTRSRHILMAAIAMERNSARPRITLIKLIQTRIRKLEKEAK